MISPGALQLLDTIVAGSVEGVATNEPPPTPATGECYLVGDAPTGEWSQYANHLAAFSAAGWRYVEPIVGLAAQMKSTGEIATYGAGGWEIGTVRASQLLVEGEQVVGAQAAAIADPVGGITADSEARAAVSQILFALRQHGLIASE